MIGTPSHDFSVNIRYCTALAETCRRAVTAGIDLSDFYIGGDALVQNARNDIVRQALVGGFDDLIFIDADQDWNPEWVFKLLSYPVDCVGAAVRKKTDEAEVYNVRAPKGPLSFVKHPAHPILTAPDMALGTGFLRLSRKALEALWNASEPYKSKGEESRWIFDLDIVDGELVGEDTIIASVLGEQGIDTWVDPAMAPGHMGEKRYAGNFASWLARYQQEALKGYPAAQPTTAPVGATRQ